jgi:hypothetical protein
MSRSGFRVCTFSEVVLVKSPAAGKPRAGRLVSPPSATLSTTFVDGALDLAIVAFAGWTLLYHLDLVLHLPTTPLLALWVLSMAAIGVGYVSLRGRIAKEPVASRDAAASQGTERGPRNRAVAGAAITLGVAAGVTAGLPRPGVPWAVPVTLGLAGVALTVVALLGGHGRPGTPPEARRGAGFGLVTLTGVGLAIASLFTVNPDADDAYFVSRSVWIGLRGHIPFRDVIFTDQAIGHIAGEAPVASIEALLGALAHLFGVSGASVTWYVFLPAVTFGAVWALWRLTRQWAPRRTRWCFVVAVVYLLWSGTSAWSFGSFHFIRMWQGKAVFVSLLVPLLFVYLTRWAERRDRRALALAVAAGVCAVGLTSTAVLLMPLMVAAVVVPLLAVRQVGAGLAAGGAAGYPLAAGLVVAMSGNTAEVTGMFRPAAAAYGMVLLAGIMGAVSGGALWAAPWLVRRGVPALIVAGIAGVTTVLLVPGVLELIRGMIPADAVLWRIAWIAPVPVLVGLLAAVRLPGDGRWLIAVPGLVAVAALLIGGQPLWSVENGSTLAARPAWKADPENLDLARTVLRANPDGGTILAPRPVMRYVPLLTVTEHAVSPNAHYLENLPATGPVKDDRELLSAVASRSAGPLPTAEETKTALQRLDITYACVWATNAEGLRLLRQTGWRHERRIGKLQCLFADRGI